MKETGKIMKEIKSLTLTGGKKEVVDAKESSRYPPIHDQIDTPTDFSMAERKWQQRRWKQVTERSRAEMSDAGGEVGGKSQHKPATERAGKPSSPHNH